METFHKVAGIIMIITPSTTFLFEQLCLDSGHLRFTRLEKGSDCLETFAPLFCFLCLNGQSVWTLDSPSQQCCGRGAGGGLGGFTVCACVCTHENSLNRSSGRRGYVYTAFDAGEKKKNDTQGSFNIADFLTFNLSLKYFLTGRSKSGQCSFPLWQRLRKVWAFEMQTGKTGYDQSDMAIRTTRITKHDDDFPLLFHIFLIEVTNVYLMV